MGLKRKCVCAAAAVPEAWPSVCRDTSLIIAVILQFPSPAVISLFICRALNAGSYLQLHLVKYLLLLLGEDVQAALSAQGSEGEQKTFVVFCLRDLEEMKSLHAALQTRHIRQRQQPKICILEKLQ